MTDITPIINGIIALVSVIITVVVIPYIKRKSTVAQQEIITAVVKSAVYAAEQLYKGTGRGEEKKKFVIDYLHEHGIDVDIDDVTDNVNVLIEAVVKEMSK